VVVNPAGIGVVVMGGFISPAPSLKSPGGGRGRLGAASLS